MRPDEQSARAAALDGDGAGSTAENLLGEWRALLRQIGSPAFSTDSGAPSWPVTVDAQPGLNHFLEGYLTRILLPCELPAIVEACEHARRGEWRELLAQDLRLAGVMRPTPFAEPS